MALARGQVPCDVLFVGEAPGQSEDVCGVPFIGPAGKLLDSIIQAAGVNRLRYCLTNLIACIPLGPEGKLDEPPDYAVEACKPRLASFIRLCQPKLLVCVGGHAGRYAPESLAFKRLKLIHPAAILRMNVAQQGLAVQRCTVLLKDAIEGL
jgi:DNA polymerase